MKIAWFTDTWIPNKDGVVTSLLLFKGKLEEKGHDISIFAPSDHSYCENNIYYYKSKKFPPYPNYRFPLLRSLLSNRTLRIIKKIKPDIIHSHSPGVLGLHAVRASNEYEIPLLFTYHTLIDDSVYLLTSNTKGQKLAKKGVELWLKWYCGKCVEIIAPSQYAAQRIKQYTNTDISIIPTGIDIKQFKEGNTKNIKKKYENKKIILTVGRIVREKNIKLLLDAAPLILKEVDAVFIIVGEGPEKPNLEKYALKKNLKNNVVFTGYISDSDLRSYYKAADAFAFPSTYETQGIVAFEAMAAKVPVVAVKSKAIPDYIIDGKNGYLVHPSNEKELAEKLLNALKNKEIIKSGYEFVKQYSIENMADKLSNLYENYEN